MLTVQRSSEYAAQGFAPTAFWPHARSHCVGLAKGRNRTSTLVTRAGPDVADRLTGQGASGALMLEAVAMFVCALAAGVVAIETWPARPAGDDELGGTP
jgi:hypothetical protein